MIRGGALESVTVGRVLTSHKRPLPWHCLALSACVVRTSFGSPCRLLLPRTCLPPAEQPMAPPRDTAGSTTPPQHFQPAAPGRYNQKSTFRNGTTEEGWFYPTPASLKAAADVRGARAVSSSDYGLDQSDDVPARRQRGGLLPALPVRQQLHVRHGAPRVTRRAGARLTCVCDPHGPRGHLPEDSGGLFAATRG